MATLALALVGALQARNDATSRRAPSAYAPSTQSVNACPLAKRPKKLQCNTKALSKCSADNRQGQRDSHKLFSVFLFKRWCEGSGSRLLST